MLITPSSTRFVMGALLMLCGYVAATGVTLAEPTTLGHGPGGNTLYAEGDAGEVSDNVLPVEGSNGASVQPRLGGPSCDCDEIGVSGGYEHQSKRMGVFTRTGTVVNGRWVYKNSEDRYLYFPSGFGWRISSDYTSPSAGVYDASFSNALCPNDVGSNFQEWDGSEWVGSVAVVCRVSAPIGCEEFSLSGEESTHSKYMGTYSRTNTRTPDGRWVYENDRDQYLFYWPQYKAWRIGSDYKYPGAWISLENMDSTLHPMDTTSAWKWAGQAWVAADVQATCTRRWPSCTKYCLDSYIGDDYCDRTCNSAACLYDGGDCGHNGGFEPYTCSGCIALGHVWCPGAALCYAQPSSYVSRPGDSEMCPYSAWVDSCDSKYESISDPLYEANQWAYDLINVEPVWASGITGAGVTINVVDLGPDHTHPDFADKYDAAASCPGSETNIDNHGTTCAAIALASANNECSRGIAYDATLSKCSFRENSHEEMFAMSHSTYALDTNMISSNSWGIPPCTSLENEGRLRRRRMQTCPFSPIAIVGTSPCDSCTDWLPGSCDSTIQQYCGHPSNYETDAECAEWTHLWNECSFQHLNPLDVTYLMRGVHSGRGGLGIVYVFAAGNGHGEGDDVNHMMLQHDRFTISVGATDKRGRHSSYSTTGASLFISAPGGDTIDHTNNFFVAAIGGGCAAQGQGTSYACPVVSGVVALMLESNPSLSHRDVQGILASTARVTDPGDGGWTTNAAGYHHNIKYGFGMVDANAAVTASRSWTSWGAESLIIAHGMGEFRLAQIDGPETASIVVPNDGTTLTRTVQAASPSPDFFIEWVEVYLTLDHTSRGDLQVELTSPSGTRSVLMPGPRPEDENPMPLECSPAADTCDWQNDGVCDNPRHCACDYNDCEAAGWVGADGAGPSLRHPTFNWKMMTVRAWGEDPDGTWTLSVTDTKLDSVAGLDSHLYSWDLFIYGHYLPPSPPPSPPPPSTSPSPPPSASPPSPPSAQSGEQSSLRVVASFTASGEVSDFDEATKRTILAKLAQLAGLSFVPLDSTLEVTAGSVIIVAKFPVVTELEANLVQSSLASYSEADFEAQMGPVLAAVGSAVVTTVVVEVKGDPKPTESDGSPVVAISAAAAGVAVVAALGGGYVYYKKKRRADEPSIPMGTPVEKKIEQGNTPEAVNV